jgi:hypothetical protein
MKHIIALLAISLAACGGGSVYEDEAPAPVVVKPIPTNYCTDGFVVGPCTPLPEPVCGQPNEVVVGPTPACRAD